MQKPYDYPSNLLYSETAIFDPRKLFFINITAVQYKHKNELTTNSHNYKTRHRRSIHIPVMNKSVGQRSYHFLGPKLFGDLPEALNCEPNPRKFKKKLKLYVQHTSRAEIHDKIGN